VRAEFSRVSRTDRRRSRDMSRDRDSTDPGARAARSVTLARGLPVLTLPPINACGIYFNGKPQR